MDSTTSIFIIRWFSVEVSCTLSDVKFTAAIAVWLVRTMVSTTAMIFTVILRLGYNEEVWVQRLGRTGCSQDCGFLFLYPIWILLVEVSTSRALGVGRYTSRLVQSFSVNFCPIRVRNCGIAEARKAYVQNQWKSVRYSTYSWNMVKKMTSTKTTGVWLSKLCWECVQDYAVQLY